MFSESELPHFVQPLLNILEKQAAVIDPNGKVVIVNRRWFEQRDDCPRFDSAAVVGTD